MRTEKATLFIVLFVFLAMIHLSSPAQSQEKAQPQARGAGTSVDPTDFFTRFVVSNEYRSLQSGGEINRLVPRLDYAFSKAFQIRVDVPVVYGDLNIPEIDSETGLGDILLRGTIRAARGKRYAVVLATDLVLDTASEDILGLGKYRLGPLGFASIEVPSLRSRFFPFYQHYFSFAGDDNRRDINCASFRPSVILTKWPNRWYTVIDPNFFIDFEQDADSGMTLEIEVGRSLSKNVNIWIRPGVGVFGDIAQVYDWNLEGGLRYYFR